MNTKIYRIELSSSHTIMYILNEDYIIYESKQGNWFPYNNVYFKRTEFCDFYRMKILFPYNNVYFKPNLEPINDSEHDMFPYNNVYFKHGFLIFF